MGEVSQIRGRYPLPYLKHRHHLKYRLLTAIISELGKGKTNLAFEITFEYVFWVRCFKSDFDAVKSKFGPLNE